MSADIGGDDVYTGRLGPRQSVSNYCSEAQITQIISELSRRSSLPPHIMVWWTGTVNTVPNGWALMNGILNSPANGGSGTVLVDRFVLGAASGAGQTEDATNTSTEGHEHNVIVEPTEPGEPSITATLLPSATNIHRTNQATFDPPDATVTGGKGQTKLGGEHQHEAETDEVEVILEQAGLHGHENSNTEDATIAAHTCEDVADCVADHAAHTHVVTWATQDLEDAAAGAIDIKYHAGGATVGGNTTNESMEHSASGASALGHGTDNKHKHSITGVEEAGLHTHPTVPHSHEVLFKVDGEHQHEVHDHTHTVTWGEAEHHHHKITDPGHTHPYTPMAEPHSHDARAIGGDHEHATGRPDNMKLLPIEKLDVL
jgi:hypothetical protein